MTEFYDRRQEQGWWVGSLPNFCCKGAGEVLGQEDGKSMSFDRHQGQQEGRVVCGVGGEGECV